MTPQLKTIVALNASSTTSGSTASGIIDTLGYDWATIDVIATVAAAAGNTPTTVKLQESDTTSGFVDIAAFATPASFPAAATLANQLPQNNFKFNVDCRSRKRYLQAVYVPSTLQTVTIVANLGRGEQAPVTAAKANAMALIEG
jgi:hypothetical protein